MVSNYNWVNKEGDGGRRVEEEMRKGEINRDVKRRWEWE